MIRQRRLAYAIAASALVTGVFVVPAAADNTRVIPRYLNMASLIATRQAPPQTGTSVVFKGHGFGHGRGMSQWGAYGAAQKAGLSWQQILDFYYPGTGKHTMTNSELRVKIVGDKDGDTQVLPAAGLFLTGPGRTPVTLPVGNAYRRWRVVPVSGTLQVQYLNTSNSWAVYPGSPSGATALGFGTSAAIVNLVLPGGSTMQTRGAVLGAMEGSTHRTVVYTTLETYLRGVVPSEMPAYWHPQALAAQSVAARTYAAAYRQRQRNKNAVWDICDTTTCQVYRGNITSPTGTVKRYEDSRVDAAIASTAGTVLRTSSSTSSPLAYTEFSASNGGHTVGGGVSYLPSKPDPYDGAIPNSLNSWTKTVPIAQFAAKYGYQTVTSVAVTARDGLGVLGGHATQVRIIGNTASETGKVTYVTGSSLRSAYSMRSTWYTVAVE